MIQLAIQRDEALEFSIYLSGKREGWLVGGRKIELPKCASSCYRNFEKHTLVDVYIPRESNEEREAGSEGSDILIQGWKRDPLCQ